MKTNPLISNRMMFQNANPTIGPRRQPVTTQPEASVPTPRGNDVVILSRAAVAQGRPPGAQDSQGVQAATKDSTPTATLSAAANPASSASRGTSATFGQSDLDAIREHFGSRAGDEGFNAQADADGNGVVDFGDMTHVLANWGQTRS
ncbi:MAG: hypothetical protein JNK58_04390 [Phycisphaerae bacterium]|nr:hypothetical protein [Phycisphaerae bacterium]